MYEEIKALIKNKKNDIDEVTLTYFTNYFYVAKLKDVIPKERKLEDLIDNALVYASKVEFYDENHWVYKKYGKDVKGLRDSDSKTIFVRKNLSDDLKEMLIYHELHHAVQTNPLNNEVGINQVSNIGRMIMEAQTQYFAEVIYEEIHGVKFDEREIASENLRMLPNGTVVSCLHNYEMYDCMLSKIATSLDVSKDFFVSINYLGKENIGMKLLEQKYNEAKDKYQLPYDFNNFLYNFDYIYVVDLLAYAENKNKQLILSGEEPDDVYEIWPDKGLKVSLAKQRACIDSFDTNFVLALIENNGDYIDFAKYIIDNNNRKIIGQYIENNISKSVSKK